MILNELTPHQEDATISLKNLLEVNMGSYREFRPGRWRITFYFKGERFDVYRNENNEPLETERQSVKTLAYIEQLIKRKSSILKHGEKKGHICLRML